MNTYKLLTPGPLTTTMTVKEQMLFDHCTWDDDYKAITQEIRAELVRLGHCDPAAYTAVLMQGSGTFGDEAVLTGVVGDDEKVLVCSNGAYGERMVEICRHARVPRAVYAEPYDQIPQVEKVAAALDADPAITHVMMVHSETTSGLMNDVESVGALCHERGKVFMVDAMSSFACVDIPVQDWHIDFLVSSANKGVQGVPGFSFVLCRRDLLEASRGKARSLSMDLYDQWVAMEKDGKWRYTSPTHVVLAFRQALRELEAEGGIPARAARYAENQRLLMERMEALGFRLYLAHHQGPVITTFFYPEGATLGFGELYDYIKERGYVIYPGKLTDEETFRLGNIGEIYPADIMNVTDAIADFLAEHK